MEQLPEELCKVTRGAVIGTVGVALERRYSWKTGDRYNWINCEQFGLAME